MRGRKPKPTSLKVLRGNPGQRPINEREPKPKRGKITCPAHLDAMARTEWRRVAPLLSGSGVLTHADRAALAAYCQVYSRWSKAERALAKEGEVIEQADGKWVVNPYVRVASDALRHLRSFASELGLTPASRTRISVEAGDDEDELAVLLAGSKN